MRKTYTFFVLILLLGCNSNLGTSPTNASTISNGSVHGNWSPYVGVHAFSVHENIQRPHLQKLIDAGKLNGVRTGADITHPSLHVMMGWLSDRGIDILSIFPNEYLREPNVEEIFAQHVNAYPYVNVWEIGNEVTTFVEMEPEEYMPIFKRLFYFAKREFPGLKIAAQAPAGNGEGAERLKKMIDLGLDNLVYDGMDIVVIHFYSWRSTRLDEFKSEIGRLPPNRRIWVTETNERAGDDVRWEDQIEYVNTMYPRIRNSLSAERTYWYVFSSCDDFALVKGLPNVCRSEPIYSPLMKALLGL